MKCQFCSKPATMHQIAIVDNEKREMHLCQACAESKQLIKDKNINLPAILQSLIGQHIGPEMDELAKQNCPMCGIRYMEFRAQGRLGCPHDYTVFRSGLDPLIQRIHRLRAPTKHVGKRPKQGVPTMTGVVEIAQLRRQLQEAVVAEKYEEAARLRDLLREREKAVADAQGTS